MKGFRYGFGFVPNFKKLLLGDGGGSPSLPTAGNQGYYSADDINTLGFSSANNLNWWQDEGIAGSSNDLTQGTASANMTFIEHDTVTQFTLANQPTLVDLGGGELAVDVTGSSKYFNNFPFINDGDFVIEYIIDAVFDTQSTFTHRIGNDYIRFRETGIDINNPTGGQGFTQFFFGQTLSNGEYLLKIKRSVDDVSVYLEGVQVDVTKAITGIWSIPQILGSTHTTNGGAFKRVSLWNSADDSGAPDFELLPTEESCNVLAGQQVSRWNSTNHKPWLNYVENTVTQFLEGLSPQNGSFTYVLRANLTDPVTAGAMISSSIDSSGLFNVDADTLDFRDGAGTNNNFDFDNFDDVSAYAFTFDGTTLTGYKNSCVSFTLPIDATGQAFNLTDLGASTAGATMQIYETAVYDSVLSQTDLDYFSYLRSEDTNEILLPPLTPDCSNDFAFSVKTDNAGGVSANNQFKVGTTSTGVYDFTVEWGDGSSDVITTWDDPALTHTYSVDGTYTIKISGTSFTYPYFYNGDDTKVLDVSNWGLTDYGTTASDSFRGCSNLTLSSSDIPDTSSVTTMKEAWRGCSSLTSFPLIDTSSVTNMFSNWLLCSSLTSFPLINTSSVTSMSSTWYQCSSLTSFPLINTSLVKNMTNTWYQCSSLTSFPLINTSSVTSMLGTWRDCLSLTSFPLIDTSSCINFSNTWLSCALNSSSIDNIMQALVNGNQSNLTTDISGGTNLGFASWSAGAVANYNTLISRGWTITTNP